MRPPIQLPQSVTSFYDYFKLTPDAEEAAEVLGYSFDVTKLVLPHTTDDVSWAYELQREINTLLPRVRLTSETARRELLIAPILIGITRRYDVQLRLEYRIKASETLQGDLDYYLHSREQFVVIEAKNDDMARGASQLVAEMVALDKLTPSESSVIYGAVSIGTLWQFVVLNRGEQRFDQDIALYRVPNEVQDICAILIGILRAERDADTQP